MTLRKAFTACHSQHVQYKSLWQIVFLILRNCLISKNGQIFGAKKRVLSFSVYPLGSAKEIYLYFKQIYSTFKHKYSFSEELCWQCLPFQCESDMHIYIKSSVVVLLISSNPIKRIAPLLNVTLDVLKTMKNCFESGVFQII